jgi:DNA-binding transcriptional ArsR family regulator
MKGLDATLAALADPTRRAILARLALGEATVTELVRPFDMSQPAISKHLRVLERAGLVARRASGTTRPCRLTPRALDDVDGWLNGLRAALTANYTRLDAVLAAMQRPARSAATRPPATTRKRGPKCTS